MTAPSPHGEVEKATGWQPIETLAADGHSVLLWLGDFHVASKLNIRIGYRTPVGFFGTGGVERKLENVTHWMPLPSPPAAETPVADISSMSQAEAEARGFA